VASSAWELSTVSVIDTSWNHLNPSSKLDIPWIAQHSDVRVSLWAVIVFSPTLKTGVKVGNCLSESSTLAGLGFEFCSPTFARLSKEQLLFQLASLQLDKCHRLKAVGAGLASSFPWFWQVFLHYFVIPLMLLRELNKYFI
jgi:hypothetical protein